jgi:hypothetical protein
MVDCRGKEYYTWFNGWVQEQGVPNLVQWLSTGRRTTKLDSMAECRNKGYYNWFNG